MEVIKGEFEFIVNGETKVYTSGMIVKIPTDLPHAVKVLTDCIVTDVYFTVREEYKEDSHD